MNQADGNPAANELPAGVSEEALRAAIERSGFPLQMLVGEKLRQMGWRLRRSGAFSTRTPVTNAIDLLADWHANQGQRVVSTHLSTSSSSASAPPSPTCSLALLVLSSTVSRLRCRSPTRFRGTHYGSSTAAPVYNVSVLALLGLDGVRSPHPRSVQLHSAAPCGRAVASLTSLAVRRIRDSCYRSRRRLSIFDFRHKPTASFWHFTMRLGMRIAVIDAPLVCVATAATGATSAELRPWTRLYRHENVEADHPSFRERMKMLDVVHSAFLETYLTEKNPALARDLLPATRTEAFRCHRVGETHSGWPRGRSRRYRIDIATSTKGRPNTPAAGPQSANTKEGIWAEDLPKGEAVAVHRRGARAPLLSLLSSRDGGA